ncbi:MAG: prephenate dehydrogenase/arogenate dehydrogenase family protein [Acidobacteria bacterium]|nr:prephenate dehydrogenase/arogenate dehydrogenase family protein [Acidobacteriota bacterium]
MKLTNVTIFGAGLIGGSLALALKRAFPGVCVAGVDKPEVLERAERLKIIDAAGARPADLVVIATPVGDILKLLDRFISGETLVTDVGSTKAAICHKAERLGVPFVGGHPMAGLEQSGPEAASADLFNDAAYFLCRVRTTPPGAMERMQDIVKAVGATPHVISPEEHDRLVARISHLPQMISTLLADHTAAHKNIAGPGLRSMTRLAGSPFHVWRDIFKTSGFLPHELQSFIQRLQNVLDSMEAGNFDEVESLFKRGGSQ